ncbi:MAG: IS3 family transposase [Planctomycetaceae bacterium]
MQQVIFQEAFPVSVVCRTLNVSRSGFHAWKRERVSPQREQEEPLHAMICEIFHQHKQRYGARRIAAELRERNVLCGVDRVSRVMKTLGLRAIQPKSFKPRTTESRHTLGYNDNLLLNRPQPVKINEVWVGDITYLPLCQRGQFAYLALLMDLYSRRVVGWDVRGDMTTDLVLAALEYAIRSRAMSPGLLHHTDRGGQYAGKKYRGVLRRHGILQSMSRAGNCYDNAFLESCFGTIKTELEITEYKNSECARAEIHSYLSYYNLERKHSALNYQSPHQFEQQTTRK